MSDLATFRAKVARYIRDGAGILLEPDLDAFIEEAVRRYSRVKRREVVADIVGDGSFDYDMPAPFDTEFSNLELVEFPAGRREPEYVDELDWQLYESPTGTKLRFLHATPAASQTIRVTFTALHTVDAASTTVPAADHDVIHLVAAALGCEALAAHYANAGDATIAADSVDHKSKSREYALRGKRYMTMANELLPIPEQGAVSAAGGQASLGQDENPLTHPRR